MLRNGFRSVAGVLVSLALEVPAIRVGWLSNEAPHSLGFLLAVWLETGVARDPYQECPPSGSTDPETRGGV